MAWWTKQKPKRVVGDAVIGRHFFAEEAVEYSTAGEPQYQIRIADYTRNCECVHYAWNRAQAIQIIALLDAEVDREDAEAEQEKKQNIS